MNQTGETFRDEDFRPRGAMLFLILLLFLGAVIWFGIYFIMLNRS